MPLIQVNHEFQEESSPVDTLSMKFWHLGFKQDAFFGGMTSGFGLSLLRTGCSIAQSLGYFAHSTSLGKHGEREVAQGDCVISLTFTATGEKANSSSPF